MDEGDAQSMAEMPESRPKVAAGSREDRGRVRQASAAGMGLLLLREIGELWQTVGCWQSALFIRLPELPCVNRRMPNGTYGGVRGRAPSN